MTSIAGRGRYARETYPEARQPAALSPGANSFIVYAPALLNPAPPVYNDWNEIETIVNARQGACRLLIDQSGGLGFADIPATANLDGQGRLEIVGAGPRGEPQMLMADGAQIKNVRAWKTVVVRANPTIRAPVQYDLNGLDVECFDATFKFGTSGVTPTKPIIEVVPNGIVLPNGYLAMFMKDSSAFQNGNAPGKAVLHLGANSLLFFPIGDFEFSSSYDKTISGDVSSTLILQTDASLPNPATINLAPEFAGTITTFQIDRAQGVAYDPAVVADWNGSPPTTVQEALDRIAALIGPIP